MTQPNLETELKAERLKIGLRNEPQYLDDIRECFLDFGEINKTIKENDPFDFSGHDCLFELKTRFCNFYEHTDTIVGDDKAKLGLKMIEANKNQQVFFLFAYPDKGLFFWELTREKYNKLVVEKTGCHLRRTGQKNYILIPMKQLTYLCDTKPIMSEKYLKLKQQYDRTRGIGVCLLPHNKRPAF